ncbi:putative C6 zinc finger domain-containing protein [Rosellinia necatrix]|uniref:Putative C6 zinc finger domain-containing protein n=1 Tax=Rosellinia necatrix TaxID=77044 RepID=A0A1W2TE18_ROSNE|nr:putative C6 zinc finger domain-containing protein [Rosellinia necatrix]
MEEQPRRRRRPALSCLACRRRKLKCDRANPCARCVLANTNCTYRAAANEAAVVRVQGGGPTTLSPRASPPPQTLVNNRGILAPGHEYGLSTPGVRLAAPVTPLPEHLHGGGSFDALNPTDPRDATPELQELRQRIRKLEELATSGRVHGLAETGRHILTRQAGLRDSEITLKKTRLLRWSDWMGIAPEFQPVYQCFEVACGGGEGSSFQSDETKALITEIDQLYKKCKRVARGLKANRPSRCLSSPRPNLEPPPREIADPMVTAYFHSFESVHRILHEPSFWAEYQRFWEAPASITTGQRLQILLVIGLGSSICDGSGPDSELRRRVQQWIYTAQAWLSGPLEKDRLDIQGLQVHCLATLARQIFSIGGDLVWMSMGSLVHRAMQIGLHRDPKHLPTMPLLQAEIRRRLWYTIVELLVQSSLDSAMPPRLSLADFDTEHPSNNNDGEIDESTTALLPHPQGTYTSTSLQLLLIESLPTRLRTVQLLNGLHSELAYPDVITLSSEITGACNACSKYTTKNRSAGITAFQSNLSDYLVRRFLIPLHCPFASESRTNPLFHYSQKVTLDAALAFISPEPDVSFSRLMATGGGMYREGFRCATSAITLELLVQAQSQRDDGTYKTNPRQLDFLKQAVDDITAMAWERIRQGETNIKGPIFLGIVLAVANSVDKDALCEFTMAKNARDSLILCLQILETRARTAPLPSPGEDSLASSSLDGDRDGFGLDFSLDFFFPGAGEW